MKNKYESIKKIPQKYTSDDGVQVMIPYLDDAITLLNSKEIVYHYRYDSKYFVNKYNEDERRKKFIKYEDEKQYKKIKYVKQILDYNKIYIEIADEVIKEYYAYYDNETKEAFLITKYLFPKQKETKIMNYNEFEKMLKNANGGIYSGDGGVCEDIFLPNSETILEYYKEALIKIMESEKERLEANSVTPNKELEEYFNSSINKLTINDIPSGKVTLLNDTILITNNNDEINIESIVIKYDSPNNYILESYKFPVVNYNKEVLDKLKQEPKSLEKQNPILDRTKINNKRKKVLKLINE